MSTSPVVTITEEQLSEMEADARYGSGYIAPGNAIELINDIRALLAERAQLKRDAERYWWLNDSPHSFGILRAMSTGDLTGPMVDDAIDAAMQAAQ